MQLSLDQVGEMAPDAASAAAGKKLMAVKNWEELGQSDEALWGKCRGSAVYQVKIELATLGYQCSCPSRKFPCKHTLGLLMMAAAFPQAIPAAPQPDWIDDWLSKRKDRAEKKAAREETPKKPVDETAQAKRAEQRENRVADGLARLDLWIKDLVRSGLGGVEARPSTFWEEQARRLVDAQAPALAGRVKRLAEIPRSSPDWPLRLLAELGRLKLLLHAYQRLDQLEPGLQADVRQLIGWNVSQAELEAQGERLADRWIVIGQRIDDEERIRAQISWLVGRESRRTALVLQFAPPSQGFPEAIVPGVEQQATLLFYPGAVRQRAKIVARDEQARPFAERAPGHASIASFLDALASDVARQPWLASQGLVLHDVSFVPRTNSAWLARDMDGAALPLAGRDHWRLLALTGGRPCDLTGEWDGRRLRPLGIYLDGAYRVA